jgi:mRNA interferase RelE/StbE
MRVVLSRRARRDLDALPKGDALRLIERLEVYAAGEPGDVKLLAGDQMGYRLRSGSWRALFDVRGDELIVRRIGHRREVYR